MRRTTPLAPLALLLSGLVCLAAAAQDDAPETKVDPLARRYSLGYSPAFYPQKTPQEAMASVVKALNGRRMDYLLAHLSDPKYVDERVAGYKAEFAKGKEEARIFLAFGRLMDETGDHFLRDPQLLRDLRRFAAEAEWEAADTTAVGSAKTVPGRKVFLRRVGDRWFLENRQQ